MPAAVRFGTKAETLARLTGRLRHGTILPLDHFTVGTWRQDPERILDRVAAHEWARDAIIVRSSGLDEDSEASSNAGRYLSCPHVRGRRALRAAVEEVIASFERCSDADQVLVQPELEAVVASGVASSHEPSSGSPYRVVTYSESGDTDAVTAGHDGTRTWYFLTGVPPRPPARALRDVPLLIDELETLVHGPFELEFGVAADGTLVLFQVRPLVMRIQGVPRDVLRAAIGDCRALLRKLSGLRPPAAGARTCFGVMPDWNPAEMIGVRPRPLALSLYKSLICDEVWAQSRAAYGYRDLRGLPLLVDFHGLPYIDVRASFSSLVPAATPEPVAERLVEHHVATLRAQPHLHDKIESAIALTAYDFDAETRARRLVDDGVLSAAEAADLLDALRTLTAGMLADDGAFAQDLEVAAQLAQIRPEDDAEPDATPELVLRSIAAQLDRCRRWGTLPFSGLARAAFVAVGFVDSAVRRSILTTDERAALIGGANEVTESLRRDFHVLDRDAFLARYGHLRPGTYDIRSPRYDESFERYFDPSQRAAPVVAAPRFTPSARQRAQIADLLAAHELGVSADELLEFIRRAIAARERAKLDFTRLVSHILLDVRRAGERLGFDASAMSYVSVDALAELADARDPAGALAAAIQEGRERHRVTRTLCGPALLGEEGDFESFVTMRDEPNFVTHRRVVAPPADVLRGDALDGRIAMIASADPGCDWIFTHDITGLITAFGGANSHMALRALELRLPAAIGVGEERFERWLGESMLELDAANRFVRPMPGAQAPAVAADEVPHAAALGGA